MAPESGEFDEKAHLTWGDVQLEKALSSVTGKGSSSWLLHQPKYLFHAEAYRLCVCPTIDMSIAAPTVASTPALTRIDLPWSASP